MFEDALDEVAEEAVVDNNNKPSKPTVKSFKLRRSKSEKKSRGSSEGGEQEVQISLDQVLYFSFPRLY